MAFTPRHRDELEARGFTVVEGVLDPEHCDRLQDGFRNWLSIFPKGTWPQTRNSLIQRYKSGHLEPTWETRLAVKPVFEQIWGTPQLLSSMDAIAIGRPPEEGQEKFWAPNDSWLHVDQSADREGLHAYQGAVYLEHCAEDDWTFEVIEGSHKHFDEFTDKTGQWRCRNLDEEWEKWFKEKGCLRMRVPCPKGGMILWDSRLFHANARPIEGRANPGRWRFVVFVCMAPAVWASESDLGKKRRAYKDLQLTTHWPSQEVHTFKSHIHKGQVKDPNADMEMPDIAKTDEAMQLAGMLPYDYDAEDAGYNFTPKWNKEKWAAAIENFKAGELQAEKKHKKPAFKAR